jgi:Secretion system C-terminal sorting domain
MKKTILLFMLLLGCGIASAQVSFGYDAAGNRISRTIVLAKSLTKAATTDSIPPATEMLGELQVKIYPNPTKGKLAVEVSGMKEPDTGTVSIFNMQGGLILQGTVSSSPTELDISGQPAGTYVMRISVGGKNTTWKIQKE